MSKMKRILSAAMAAALALSAAACTNSGSSSASGTQGGDSSGTSSTVSSGVELTGEINKYGWDVPKAVSYTHLDVYKRQGEGRRPPVGPHLP